MRASAPLPTRTPPTASLSDLRHQLSAAQDSYEMLIAQHLDHASAVLGDLR